jgi:hypothetical protein
VRRPFAVWMSRLLLSARTIGALGGLATSVAATMTDTAHQSPSAPVDASFRIMFDGDLVRFDKIFAATAATASGRAMVARRALPATD